jgi:hypothetical protein
MRNLGLLLLPLVVAALVAFSPVRSDTGESRKSPAPYEDLDAYQVYSIVLSMGGGWQDSKSLLILQNIPPKEWPTGSPQGALQGNAEFSKQFDGIFKSFEQANSEPLLVQYHFAIPKPYQIVSSAELDATFRRRAPNTIDDGWEGFRQSFPDSMGYLILSAVGFNSERTIALVYVEYRCGGLCGSSRYYTLEKRDGRWVRSAPKGLKSEMRGNS